VLILVTNNLKPTLGWLQPIHLYPFLYFLNFLWTTALWWTDLLSSNICIADVWVLDGDL
jgi:hypothetical protein